METTERFPQRLGNLAGEREIPTFPPPIIAGQRNQQKKGDWTATTDSGTLSARSDEGTPGGKVLKSRGPYLLQTDTGRVHADFNYRRGSQELFKAWPAPDLELVSVARKRGKFSKTQTAFPRAE